MEEIIKKAIEDNNITAAELVGTPQGQDIIKESVKVAKEQQRKISEPKVPCNHPEHNPPSGKVFEPGTYRHTCPKCGKSYTFYALITC